MRYFTLPSKEEDMEQEDINIDLKRKAFGELVIACMIMSRYPSMRAKESFQCFIDHLDESIKPPHYGFNMMRRPNLFPTYVIDTVGLEACGRSYPEYRFAIQRLLDSGYIDTLDRTPWNQIDLRQYLDCGDYTHTLPSFESLFQRSIAVNLPPVPYMRIMDVYALTHIIFHTADFGRRDLRPIFGERFDGICEEVTLLLGAYTYAKDWDLVSELLMCCYCLGFRPLTLYKLAWEGLKKAQTPLGDIPYRRFDPQHPDLQNPETADLTRFRCNYHTTLVGLFAAMLERYHEERS